MDITACPSTVNAPHALDALPDATSVITLTGMDQLPSTSKEAQPMQAAKEPYMQQQQQQQLSPSANLDLSMVPTQVLSQRQQQQPLLHESQQDRGSQPTQPAYCSKTLLQGNEGLDMRDLVLVCTSHSHHFLMFHPKMQELGEVRVYTSACADKCHINV